MNNQITNNSGEGIYLDDCYKGGLIESNNIYSNGCGVEVWEIHILFITIITTSNSTE